MASNFLHKWNLSKWNLQKNTPSIHKKKDTPDLSATVGRGMKPKIQGSGSMAMFSVVPHPILLLNVDCVKKTTGHATVNKMNLI
jgi:hypothetical protein